ncbi:MAG: LptF/LptG family permease [Geothrix sp.]|uniref:LptF/LptG family permease n=1 Tax=Geothrix sp. TaxID=1962974 RepID=UPI0017D47BAD|nr:LptF/LptG family permease [Geothrix sp.]NWJ39556.1 LptF/LptG family permease [Geothrix sp.]WIL19223.1 MAG: LptF/LptG family permease [Geothrix sp.]
MHSVLSRYVLRRWATPFLGALLFYGFLLLSWEMVTISKEIFSQGAPLRWLLPMLLTSMPENLGLVLPMAAVLGGLLGTQQLMEGSELVAAQGLGAGRRTWTAPWLKMAFWLVLLATLNAHVLVPAAARLQQTVRVRMTEDAKARFLRPGAPPWFPPGAPNSAFWVSPEGQVHIMESTPQGVQHLTASTMTYALEAKPDGSSELQLHLTGLQGALYQTSGQGSVIHLSQEKQVLRFGIPAGTRLLPPTPLRYESSAALLGILRAGPLPAEADREARDLRLKAAMEFCRRTTLPLAAAALLLLGIAVGFGHPRFHRGGAILKSLGIIMLYYLVMKYFETMWMNEKIKSVVPLLLVPFPFLAGGWLLLRERLKPHRSNPMEGGFSAIFRPIRMGMAPLLDQVKHRRDALAAWLHGKGTRHGILRHWSSLAWWRNWGSALGSLLVLNLLVEYASLAGDLSKNGVHFVVFIQYWFWNLPPFLVVALPISFLLGTLLTLSEAALSREWLALRAGGVSLLRWLWSSRWAWGLVAALTLVLQVGLAPRAMTKANQLYRQILNRPQGQFSTRPWLYLGSTGVLWHLQAEQRWGFPLKAPGEAPLLLRWQMGETHSEALAWGGLRLVQGPPVERLFPARALRNTVSAEEAQTIDLVHWQLWAPDPERAYMLWGRLLGWLAGPCLVLAMLSFAFPGPRQGRGQAMGAGLVAGLVFLGLQTLFGGAARASEIPAYWGVLAPLFLLLSVCLLRLRRLRT